MTGAKLLALQQQHFGGGGGVMTGFGDWATKNAGLRITEGLETGADRMVSICPFCHYNLNEGAKRLGSSMTLHDLTELIDEVLPEIKALNTTPAETAQAAARGG